MGPLSQQRVLASRHGRSCQLILYNRVLLNPSLPYARRHRQPIMPKSAVQPYAGDAFALPANFMLKPRGSGQPLPEPIQKKMEGFFNASFAEVRIHVGNEAPSIGALAFTHGTDLYFAPGQYNPQSPQGQQLLGHELTHVVQQRAGRVRNPLARASWSFRTRRWRQRPSGRGCGRRPLPCRFRRRWHWKRMPKRYAERHTFILGQPERTVPSTAWIRLIRRHGRRLGR